MTFGLFGLALLIILASTVLLFVWKRPLAIAAGEKSSTTSTRTYFNSMPHYTITYPANFTVNPLYSYKATGPGQAVPGVSFTIPISVASGTNLSLDSFLSVESLATSTCSMSAFFGNGVPTSTQSITDNRTTYTFAKSAAGKRNHYEEYLYVLNGTSPCIAVRYFIQSTNIADYIPGTAEEFNHDGLLTQFDTIRRSLKLN